ncbi:hypothetical protein HKD37_12G033645 [Glycine soja]
MLMGVKPVGDLVRYLGQPTLIDRPKFEVDSSGTHWMSWNKLTDAKYNGGLSFRCMKAFNMDMHACKTIGEIGEYNEDSLVVWILKSRCYPRSNPLDRWTPNTVDNCIHSAPLNNYDESTLVADLVDVSIRQWGISKVRSMFNEPLCSTIMNLPLNMESSSDF